MQLTPDAQNAVSDLSQRYGVSADAVQALLSAVSAGGGTMAQFNHPELGGGGQWMSGGMTMVGDMFNSGLQSTVSGLCSELSNLLASTQVFVAPPAGGGTMASGNSWWPAELGNPSSSGGQNNARYAYFPHCCRLAVEHNGYLAVYDTLDNQIGGVQQQQGGGPGSLSFSSQFGTFTVDSLPQVNSQRPLDPPPPIAPPAAAPPPPAQAPPPMGPGADFQPPQGSGRVRTAEEVVAAVQQLAQLHQQGILSNDEFANKKAELLALL